MNDDMPAGASPAAAAQPRKWNVALIVSLCLNFLLAGALVVPVVRWSLPFAADDRSSSGFGHGMHGHGHGRGFGLGQGLLNPHVVMQVAPDKADAIKRILDAHRSKFLALRDAAMAARGDAASKLDANNFSQADFDRSLVAVRDADNALETEVLRTVSEFAGTLSAKERQAAIRNQMQDDRNHGPSHRQGKP